jgi:hypothetical protein
VKAVRKRADDIPQDALSDLVSPSQARVERFAHIYQSDASLDWALRRNRDRLIEGGALVIVNGRKMLKPDRFAQVMLEIGKETAQRAAPEHR